MHQAQTMPAETVPPELPCCEANETKPRTHALLPHCATGTCFACKLMRRELEHYLECEERAVEECVNDAVLVRYYRAWEGFKTAHGCGCAVDAAWYVKVAPGAHVTPDG